MGERCKYCSKAFTEYPLFMSDDADQKEVPWIVVSTRKGERYVK